MSLDEFRSLYSKGKIREDILDKWIVDKKGIENHSVWKTNLLEKQYSEKIESRIGKLRHEWENVYHIDINSRVHSTLFRIVASFLDQGISIWNFPIWQNGFLLSLKEMELNSFSSFFKTPKAKKILLDGHWNLDYLLSMVVGDKKYYKQYLFKSIALNR